MTSEVEQLEARKHKLQLELNFLELGRNAQQRRAAALRNRADGLAAQFKSLYAQASQAYNSGTKEGREQAASLSQAGRGIEAQCRALNAQAKSLGGGSTQDISRLKADIQALNGEIRAAKERARSASKVKSLPAPQKAAVVSTTEHLSLSGFENSEFIDEGFVRKAMRYVHPAILAETASFSYVASKNHGFDLGATTAKPQFDNPAEVRLFAYPEAWLQGGVTRDAIRMEYFKTILHEFGHVLLDRLLPPMKRYEWGELFHATLRDEGQAGFISNYASMSKGEDFGECYMFYTVKPERLRKYPEKFALIDQAVKELK